MTEILDARLELATVESFRPFGHLIDCPRGVPTFKGQDYRTWRYEFSHSGMADLTLLQFDFRPLACSRLEKHPVLTEVRVPLDHKGSVIFVATGEKEPRPSDVRAFLISGQAAVLIKNGCWHSGSYPLDPGGATFILLSDIPTETELETASATGPSIYTQVVDWTDRFSISTKLEHALTP